MFELHSVAGPNLLIRCRVLHDARQLSSSKKRAPHTTTHALQATAACFFGSYCARTASPRKILLRSASKSRSQHSSDARTARAHSWCIIYDVGSKASPSKACAWPFEHDHLHELATAAGAGLNAVISTVGHGAELHDRATGQRNPRDAPRPRAFLATADVELCYTAGEYVF